MEKNLFEGKKYSFRKGSFSPLNRFYHHKEEREEKVLCTKVNYFLYRGMVSPYKREGSFIKVEKGIQITFSKHRKASLDDGFFFIQKGRIV
jgi:hypothetical protein